ncbi:YciI family protein [Saccharopolyspora taberi]|uniref:YciI family protein n=2 Tax=Saccharopolyspora taberi TaxID=60895 RepID=A0ABN3V2J0_9PSEU
MLHYTAPAEEVNLVLPDHSNWINRHYQSGDFIIEGRRSPRPGSVIIACDMARGRLDAILATDPLVREHLVRPEVITFEALRTVPELARYADRLAGG